MEPKRTLLHSISIAKKSLLIALACQFANGAIAQSNIDTVNIMGNLCFVTKYSESRLIYHSIDSTYGFLYGFKLDSLFFEVFQGKDSQLPSIVKYQISDKAQGVIFYDERGNVTATRDEIDGKNGWHKIYHTETGTVDTEWEYSNGIKTGNMNQYDPYGNLLVKGFANGEMMIFTSFNQEHNITEIKQVNTISGEERIDYYNQSGMIYMTEEIGKNLSFRKLFDEHGLYKIISCENGVNCKEQVIRKK